MKKIDSETLFSDQTLKPRRPKSREVSSRFLPPTSHENEIPSSNQASSPVRQKSTTHQARKHRSIEDSGFVRGLWPSSITSSPSPSLSPSSNDNKNQGTLADHLNNERLKDILERKKDKKSEHKSDVFSLSRQRSCSEFSRFENGNKKESTKENHRPVLGGSMRYTGKLRFPRKSSLSSSSSSVNSLSQCDPTDLVPGRLSVDENALHRNSKNSGTFRRKSDSFVENLDSESDCSDLYSASGCTSPAVGQNSRKSNAEVSSKYLHDIQSRLRRETSDSSIQNPVSLDTSPRIKKFNLRNAVKRANSLTGYGGSTSQWALSPGRSGSPPMSVESKEKLVSFSSLKPPSSPSRPKGVEKLLNLGLDLFKSRKSSSSSSLLAGSGNVENIHQIRLLHNRLLQWRYANARADAVNGNISKQVEANLIYAWDSLTKLQLSVVRKTLQLQKEKLEMKLNFIIHSQIKPLEAWGDLERQHLSAVSMTKECLHSVVSKVPLTEGAKVDPQSASMALRHASDLAASIKSTLTAFSPSADKNITLLSQLAEVVAQEKLLLQECQELLQTISKLEIQERSLTSYMIQLNLLQQQLQQQQPQSQEEISS